MSVQKKSITDIFEYQSIFLSIVTNRRKTACVQCQGLILASFEMKLLTTTVEKNAIHLGDSTLEFGLEMHETTFVVPVSHENWINWVIKVSCCRPVDGQRPQHAITVLQRVMAVIPGCSILPGREFVREMVSRRYWALGDCIDTVMFEAVQHSNTMPMNCSAIVFEVIDDGNLWVKVNQYGTGAKG